MQNNPGKTNMSNAAITKELSELRAQVEELRQAKKPEQTDLQPQADGLPEPGTDSIKKVLADKVGIGDAEDQIQELITALEEEIKDTNPMTMLAVFALGVLIGRLLSK
jgi:hypothetical protein